MGSCEVTGVGERWRNLNTEKEGNGRGGVYYELVGWSARLYIWAWDWMAFGGYTICF